MSGVQPSFKRQPQPSSPNSLLAQWRERSQLEFESEFFEAILARSPNYVEVLRSYGELLSRQGKREKAVQVDQQLSELLPSDCIVAYNYACSLALAGARGAAIAQLEHAVRLGYRDWRHLESDRDLESLRSDALFGELVRRIRERNARERPDESSE